MVACGHRDCDINFLPDKTRYKFCCKKCYRSERTKRINDENMAVRKKREEQKKMLEVERNKLRKIETKKEKLDRISREKAHLRSEVVAHFGEPVDNYTFVEIAEFMGIDKKTVERIYRSAMKKIEASKDLEEAYWH